MKGEGKDYCQINDFLKMNFVYTAVEYKNSMTLKAHTDFL